MNNSFLIPVPKKIKMGNLHSIMVEEVGEELFGVCPQCGVRLEIQGDISTIKLFHSNETEWIFCSDKCLGSYVKGNEPEGGY